MVEENEGEVGVNVDDEKAVVGRSVSGGLRRVSVRGSSDVRKMGGSR